ncbi:hypothetical protein Vretimale_11728 [Volvox reticuliferus]|uniref:Uncharacterized protein n=1 Tax=Volvox reticuliferus TaxID=1737510 RepID=A0A8J4LRU9_9CHLO|nr:hypothetical protein Vretifemale_20265 [Volvox reticuliferus]GIM07652.1 hypothetical protein Vretimale_11728 [Volvox reticuliferus]
MATLRCSLHVNATAYLRKRECRAVSASRGVCVRASAPEQVSPLASGELQYNRVLLTILDANPFLSDGSRTAVATAALLAKQHRSKVTVLVVDEPGTENTDPTRRLESISWHLKDRGCEDFDVVERAITSPASVLVGDVADEISADMVVLSSEAVHAKHVDANQLAEFVSCPVLLLP